MSVHGDDPVFPSVDDTQELSSDVSSDDPEDFVPQEIEPPSFVQKYLGSQRGMIYVFAEQKGMLVLFIPLLRTIGVMAIVLFAYFLTLKAEDPGSVVGVLPLPVIVELYFFLRDWYVWKHTWYLFTVNMETRRMHLRKATDVPTWLRPIIGNLELKEVPYEKLDTGAFIVDFFDGFFGWVSYRSDTASQKGDEWLKEIQHLRRGGYFKHLLTWAGQQVR